LNEIGKEFHAVSPSDGSVNGIVCEAISIKSSLSGEETGD
jgi:hypothetical protein